MQPGHRSAKEVTRRDVRRRRDLRGAPEKQGLARDLGSHVEALVRLGWGERSDAPVLTVAVYVSLSGEPGTAVLRRRLAALGHRVLLPWLREDRDLDWVPDQVADGVHAVDGADGALPDPLHPPGLLLGPGAITGTDLVLVPALAVAADGTRLGQGGGSYDRALVRLGTGTGHPTGSSARPLVLAVVHDDELLPPGALPREAHDVGVDGVLTPSGPRLLPPPAVTAS